MSEGRRQRLPYTKISPDGITPMRLLEHYLNAESGLEAVLLELVRLRVSLLNGCAFCIGLHTHELRRHNEPESRLSKIAEWAGSDAYTERERAALRWAEVLTGVAGEVPEEEFAAVRGHFADKELVDLTLAIGSINAWNRLGVAFLPQWDELKASGGGRTSRNGGLPANAEGQGVAGELVSETGAAPEQADGGKVEHDGAEE